MTNDRLTVARVRETRDGRIGLGAHLGKYELARLILAQSDLLRRMGEWMRHAHHDEYKERNALIAALDKLEGK